MTRARVPARAASRAFSRARELSTAIGEDSSIFPVLFGVWLFELTSGQHANAETTADEFLARADSDAECWWPNSRKPCCRDQRRACREVGARPRAFDRAIEIYRTRKEAGDKHLTYEYGLELGAASCAYAAWCSWWLGYPDQGLSLRDEALAIGEAFQRGYTRVRGVYWNSVGIGDCCASSSIRRSLTDRENINR